MCLCRASQAWVPWKPRSLGAELCPLQSQPGAGSGYGRMHIAPGTGLWGARTAGSSPAALGTGLCKGASPGLDRCWPQRVCMGLHQRLGVELFLPPSLKSHRSWDVRGCPTVNSEAISPQAVNI